MKLEITRVRLYGRASNGHIYVACIGCDQIATGATKAEAEANAWQVISDTMRAQMYAIGVAVANDGTVITVREYQAGQVETVHHRGHDPVLMGHGSCMSRIEIDGKPVTLRAYLAHELERYNDCTVPRVA